MKYWANLRESFYWDETRFAGSPTWAWWRFIKFWTSDTFWWINSLRCRVSGHKVICADSWCTPDSGGEEHECERCGRTWTMNYY